MDSNEQKNADGRELLAVETKNEENYRTAKALHSLRLATIRGSLEDIKSALSKGITVNQPLSGGWTALMYACSMGHPAAVQYLLQQGANPNFHKELFTPLMAVCASTQKNEDRLVRCVDLLLQHKAIINSTERHRISALIIAAKEGHVKIVERLLIGNCNMDAQDSQGWTALFWAVNQGKVNTTKVLICRGANTEIQDIQGQTVMDLAINKGFDEIVKILTEKRMGLFDSKEDTEAQDLQERKTKLTFGKRADLMLQVLLNELSAPVINNNDRCSNGLAKLLNSIEFENNIEVLKAHHQMVSKLANSVNGYFQNSIFLPQNAMVNQHKSIETSWKNIPYSALEAREVLAHMVKQVEELYASTSYMRLHMQANPSAVLVEDKHARIPEITVLSEKVLRYSRMLHDEILFFHQYAKQLEGSDRIAPADTLKECSNNSRTTITSMCVVAAVVAVILFNTGSITLSFLSK